MWRGSMWNIKHQIASSCLSRSLDYFGRRDDVHGSQSYNKFPCLVDACVCFFVLDGNDLKTVQVPKLRANASLRKSDERFVKVLQQIGSGTLWHVCTFF